jgi:hypothetical protein
MSLDSIALSALALALPAEYLLRRHALNSHDKRRILVRAIGTGVSSAAAWAMANAVDNGTTTAWIPAAQIAWGITLLGAVFTAVFLYAQAFAVAQGRELPFLNEPTESPRSRRAFRWTVIAGVAVIAVVLMAGASPTLRARLAMAGIGVFSILLALLRPGGFWDSPVLIRWRSRLGATIVRLVYIGVGVAVIIWALTTPLK